MAEYSIDDFPPVQVVSYISIYFHRKKKPLET